MSRVDDDAGDATAGLPLRVLRGAPTPEELAAAVAVVTESYQCEVATAVAEEDVRPSAWQVSARGLREPLRRDLGWGR